VNDETLTLSSRDRDLEKQTQVFSSHSRDLGLEITTLVILPRDAMQSWTVLSEVVRLSITMYCFKTF